MPPARSGWGTPWPGQDGIPPARDGVPPPPLRIDYAWTGYAARGTPLAVSCRRTFLYILSNVGGKSKFQWRRTWSPTFHALNLPWLWLYSGRASEVQRAGSCSSGC